MNGASVPAVARPATASTAATLPGRDGMLSVRTATGSTPTAAPRNCAAVIATGSWSRSRRACATVTVADSRADASTRPSPATVAPPPGLPVIRPTPASETAKPPHATGRATVRCHSAAITATSTGTAPMSRDAWLTLVRVMPAFWMMTDPP